jgi:hypothetical protein
MNDLLTAGIFSTMFYSFFEFVKLYFLKYIFILLGIKDYKINIGTYIQIVDGVKFTRKPKFHSVVITKYGIVSTDDNSDYILTTFEYFFKKISQKKQSRYFHLDYSNSVLLEKEFKCKNNQIEIFSKINSIFNEKNNCVAFIYGKPGVGKSFVSLILSQELKCSLLSCSVSEIEHYYRRFYVDNQPIIFVVDEVDIELDSIKNIDSINVSRKDEYIFTKKEWNTIFDHINLGFYPGLIILMTSNNINITKNETELRQGRIDIKYEMK